MSLDSGRCATCQWYSSVDPRDHTYRLCERIQRADDYTGLPDGATERAYVVDAENYLAALYVRPDFGCVEWHPSPKVKP